MVAIRAIAVGHPAAVRVAPPARPLYRPAPPAAERAYRPPALRRAAPLPLRSRGWLLPAAIFTLKLAASALAGATVTLLLVPEARRSAPPQERFAFDVGQETVVYAQRRTQHLTRGADVDEAMLARELPINFPRQVQVVKIFPPAAPLPPPLAALPREDEGAPSLTPPEPQSASHMRANELEGKPLRYLIGTGAAGPGRDDAVTMVSYSTSAPVKHGISIAYCNLFDELNTRHYGPYLHTSDTAKQYNEGQIDPRGPGWEKNLREQFERRKQQGFEYVELDNPDAYAIKDVIGAIELAQSYGLKVIAKNPGLMKGALEYVAHPNVYGIIVEKGAGGAADMDALRKKAGKPSLPVWFVAFGGGRGWANSVAGSAKKYHNMGVTYSSAGEYGNAIDILPPV